MILYRKMLNSFDWLPQTCLKGMNPNIHVILFNNTLIYHNDLHLCFKISWIYNSAKIDYWVMDWRLGKHSEACVVDNKETGVHH